MPSKRKGVVEPSNVEEENVNVPEPVQSNVEPNLANVSEEVELEEVLRRC